MKGCRKFCIFEKFEFHKNILNMSVLSFWAVFQILAVNSDFFGGGHLFSYFKIISLEKDQQFTRENLCGVLLVKIEIQLK